MPELDPLRVQMYTQLAAVAVLVMHPEAPHRIRRLQDLITERLQNARQYQDQLQSWENEGGAHAQGR